MLGGYQPPNTFGQCIGTLGDVNGDGVVNVVDIVTIVNHIVGQTMLSPEQQACADMDQNGVINVLDLVALVQQILGLGVNRLSSDGKLVINMHNLLKRNDINDNTKLNAVKKLIVRAGYHTRKQQSLIPQRKSLHQLKNPKHKYQLHSVKKSNKMKKRFK